MLNKMFPISNGMDENRVTYFAETDSRNKRVPFGIKAKDRSRHTYVIGKTGMGKSTLLENMAVQDINNGEGLAFIDPHGKTAELLLEYVPKERIKDVLYFAPFDLDYPISFNVMEDVGYEKRHLVASGLMSAFKKIWVDAWSARMEYILNNVLLSLLEYPDATLIGVNRMLVDKEYRKKVVDNISDPSVKAFWTDEFAKYGDRYMQEAGAAIQNKIGQFISNPLIRNIIGQPKSTFDIREIMDNKKILIINLSKGRVGEANANLLGSMLITKIYLGAMSRADSSPALLKHLPDFYLYVDEFQSFANESFADILSEARKYKLALTVAHKYIEQMSDEVRAAVFGNVGTMIAFRVGSYDAEVLEKEFAPQFTMEDLVNLGFVQIYLKLMIDGISSQPFSGATLPPIPKPLVSYKAEIIDASRRAYAHPRSEVEDAIKLWHESGRPQVSMPNTSTRLQGSTSTQSSRPQTSKFSSGNLPTQSHLQSIGQQSSTVPRAEHSEHHKIPKDEYKKPEVKKIEVGKDSKEFKESKELELRRAISLNNLRNSEVNKKDEEARKRKEAKTPSKENVNALRSALSEILKSTNQGNVQVTPTTKAVSPEQKPRETQQEKRGIPHPPESSSGSSLPHSHTSPQIHAEAPVSHAAKEPKASEPPKEVPEDVLRKMLKVDN